MKSFRNKLWLYLFLAFTLLALLTAGCGKQAGNNQPEDVAVPPEIPPITTFIMDFGKFTSPKTLTYHQDDQSLAIQLVSINQQNRALSSTNINTMGSRKNWNYAVLNVGLWSVVIVVGLVVPVAAFVESFKHKPVQNLDYTWVWTYDVPVKGEVYTAELHGRYIDNGVRWDMYTSKQDDYSDFHWYYGESNLPATEGYWILKNKPSNPTDLLRIDWHRDLSDNTHDIRYTNIVPGGPENGGYIFYGITSDEAYDRFYEIYNKGKDNHTHIQWQYITDEGRVKDTRFFGDSKWYCWDSEHYDIDCP